MDETRHRGRQQVSNERFTKGQRVQMTQQAVTNGVVRKLPVYGTVVGHGRKHWKHIRVQRDGRKTVSTYAPIFWEPIAGDNK
jgi:hypothetical protein